MYADFHFCLGWGGPVPRVPLHAIELGIRIGLTGVILLTRYGSRTSRYFGVGMGLSLLVAGTRRASKGRALQQMPQGLWMADHAWLAR